MITEFFLAFVGWFLAQFLILTSSLFDSTSISTPEAVGTGLGTVFGNIWLLNDLLPVDHLFTILGIAITWKLALFTFDGFIYLLGILNLFKRTFISPVG